MAAGDALSGLSYELEREILTKALAGVDRDLSESGVPKPQSPAI
jgi:hypothetical protein